MVDTVEKAIYELGVRGTEQLNQAAQAVDRLGAAETRRAAAGDKDVIVIRQQDIARRTNTSTIERLISQVDREERALQQLRRQRELLNRIELEGTATSAQIARASALIEQNYVRQAAAAQRLTAAANENNRALAATTVSAGATRASLANLASQVGDIGASLASGASPGRILLQQGDQIRMAFAQGGGVSATLAAARAQISAMITPTTAAVAGVTALAVGFAAVSLHALQAAEAARAYNIVTTRIGRGSPATSAEIAAANNALLGQGVTRDIAQAQRLQLATNPLFNSSLAAQTRLQMTGAGIGAALGVGAGAGFDRLIGAIQSGPQATIDLARALGALDEKQVEALSNAVALGDGFKSQQAALAALEVKYKDFAEKAMDPLTAATTGLRTAWDSLLTKLSETTAFKTATDAIIQMMNDVAGAMEGKAGSAQKLADKAGYLPPPLGNPVGAYFGFSLPGMLSRGWNAMFNQPYDTAEREQTLRDATGAPRFPMMPPPRDVPGGWLSTPITQGPFLPGSPLASANAGITAAAERLRQQIVGDGSLGRSDDPLLVQQRTGRGEIARQQQEIARAAEGYGKLGLEAAMAQAKIRATAEAQRLFNDQGDRATYIQNAMTDAAKRFNAELSVTNSLEAQRIAGEQRVTEALKQGEAAALQVAAAEQATIEVRQRGGSVAERTAQIIASANARTAQDLQRAANENERRIQLVNLEASLQGRTSEEIAKQVTLLQAKQELERRGVDQTSEIAQNYMRSSEALADANARAAQLNREQQRLEDAVRSVASTVENSLGSAFDDIFSGRKIDDWGVRLKSIVSSVLSDIVKFTLIRPAIGQPLGFGEIGTFGELANDDAPARDAA